MGALRLILSIVKTAGRQLERAHRIDVRIISGDVEVVSARVEGHVALLVDLGSDVRNLRNVGGKCVDILEGKSNLRSGFLSAGLHRGAARHQDHQLGAKVREYVGASLSETVAVSQQDHNRGNAPRHAQHSEGGAAAVEPHRTVGFL